MARLIVTTSGLELIRKSGVAFDVHTVVDGLGDVMQGRKDVLLLRRSESLQREHQDRHVALAALCDVMLDLNVLLTMTMTCDNDAEINTAPMQGFSVHELVAGDAIAFVAAEDVGGSCVVATVISDNVKIGGNVSPQ